MLIAIGRRTLITNEKEYVNAFKKIAKKITPIAIKNSDIMGE